MVILSTCYSSSTQLLAIIICSSGSYSRSFGFEATLGFYFEDKEKQEKKEKAFKGNFFPLGQTLHVQTYRGKAAPDDGLTSLSFSFFCWISVKSPCLGRLTNALKQALRMFCFVCVVLRGLVWINFRAGSRKSFSLTLIIGVTTHLVFLANYLELILNSSKPHSLSLPFWPILHMWKGLSEPGLFPLFGPVIV